VLGKYRTIIAPTKNEIDIWFSAYESLLKLRQYKPSDIWNMDEHGRSRFDAARRVVVGDIHMYGDDDMITNDSEQRTPYMRRAPSTTSVKRQPFRDHVTMIFCVNARGQHMPVCWIFKGQSVDQIAHVLDNDEKHHHRGQRAFCTGIPSKSTPYMNVHHHININICTNSIYPDNNRKRVDHWGVF
jgi:hypothetical protein